MLPNPSLSPFAWEVVRRLTMSRCYDIDLTDADKLFITTADDDKLRDELQTAQQNQDQVYSRAIAEELLKRKR